MANTYTKIHLHIICVVKFRRKLISGDWEDELYKYITGIIQNHGHKVIQINGMPDHTHILIGFRPNQSLSELMQAVKSRSAFWINQNKKVNGRFRWQSGFAAFSVSASIVSKVATYIQNQKEHHRKQSVENEYIKFLKENKVEFTEQYVFDALPDSK